MSDGTSEPTGIVTNTKSVSGEANRYRWQILRYLRACDYPATITELSEHVGSSSPASPAALEGSIRNRDLPALAKCDAIEYDTRSALACLGEDSFADCTRRAIRAGVITHLKPPRLDPSRIGIVVNRVDDH